MITLPQSIYEMLASEPMIASKQFSMIESMLYGVPVRSAPDNICKAKKWVPPADPFVTFEESDERWAKPLGFGHMKDTLVGFQFKEPECYVSKWQPKIDVYPFLRNEPRRFTGWF